MLFKPADSEIESDTDVAWNSVHNLLRPSVNTAEEPPFKKIGELDRIRSPMPNLYYSDNCH